MIVSVARDVTFLDHEIKKEAADEMPILRRCRKNTLTVLVIQFCQVWWHDDFPHIFLPGEEFEEGAAC